jgi:hypothetical protein
MTHATIANQMHLKEYLKEEDFLVEKNYDLLEEVDFFEQLQVDND